MSEARLGRGADLVVVACALAAYAAVLLGAFVYDDLHTVRDNEAIRSLSNLPRFFVDVDLFSAVECRMYRPCVLVTYALDWAVGGGAVWVFKATNLFLHIGVAVALHRLARALGASASGSLFAAAVFAAHPLASEAVNTISGRSELLLGLGLLLGVHAHLRARGDPRWAALTAAAAALACGSKEVGVVLPALLVLLDPPPLRRWQGGRAWFVRHLPAMAVVAGYLLVRRSLFGHATTTLPPLSGGSEPMAGYGRDLATQLCTMATLVPRALAQAVLPLSLSLDPPVHYERAFSPPVVCGVLFVAALSWLGLRRGSGVTRARRFGVATAWLTALPWILVPLNLPYLEHRTYVPLLGVALAVAASVEGIATSVALQHARRAVSVSVLLLFSALACRRSCEYRDPTELWRRLVVGQPDSVRGLCGLAVCHMEAGDLAAALPSVQRAVALWPSHATALRNLAELNLKLMPRPGNAMRALVAAEAVRALDPDDPLACLLHSRALAVAAEATGFAPWYDAAEVQALRCLDIAPPKGLVYRTAASARVRQGDVARALMILDQALAAGFDQAAVRLDRADCLRRLGRQAEADLEIRRTVDASPFDPAVLEFLGRRLQAAAPGG